MGTPPSAVQPPSADAASLPATLWPARVDDPDIAAGYAVDAMPGQRAVTDFTVVRARDAADVVAVLEHAQAHGIPVVPQGARTGLAGGASATPGCIVLNVEALDRIEDLDAVQGLAVVGPGVVNETLKAAAAQVGLWFSPDPASAATCTIGGNVATNAGGLCCVKYGVTADHIRGLEVVLPGGETIRTGRRTAKGVAGYDLTGLFVGSEGTLGVVTRVVVALIPRPAPAMTAVAAFDDLTRLTGAVVALRRDQARPSLVEFLDQPTVAAIMRLGDFGYPTDCAGIVLVQSDREGYAGADVERYADLLSAAGATDMAFAESAQTSADLMAGRRALNTALDRTGPSLVEDVCVPIASIADVVRATTEVGAQLGVRVTIAGHAGDGNLHPRFYYDDRDPGSLQRATAAFDALADLVLAAGGTITGEHGIGIQKAPWLRRELGDAEWLRQVRLKAFFDPRGIMNPGKVYAGDV